MRVDLQSVYLVDKLCQRSNERIVFPYSRGGKAFNVLIVPGFGHFYEFSG